MSTRCYVGTSNPANAHLVHARFVLFDGHPAAVVPTLARIWAGHAHHDTRALATAVLAHDWEYLDDAITADTSPAFAWQRPVPGVGMTLATTTAGVIDPPEPVSVFPLCQAAHLDAEWIYLIDPATATVTVHTDGGEPVSAYRLETCATPHPRSDIEAADRHERDGSQRCPLPSPTGAPR
ncbi:hypothetical protein U2F26_29265 [Micromonospora sp. 4G57]|uniref:Uncharacterized protein n=1 Tax=Micromonospora sicca TaxID=2202420 RepID=A0ABU5JLU9_9ACTN|nr:MULTISPECIES: hypothetical protein [unclassified Micromonospora]MDZ5446767.1 hypothetical protein [Micromonospora sp. 4G57]MDZ5493502.1 hypothetical protein [Micromonospora sp. 4G53]